MTRGRRIRSIRPRGKAILTGFEGEITLCTHNQLYGRWVLCAGLQGQRQVIEEVAAAIRLIPVERWPSPATRSSARSPGACSSRVRSSLDGVSR